MSSSSNNKQLSFDKTLSQYLNFHNKWWHMLQLKLFIKLNTYYHMRWIFCYSCFFYHFICCVDIFIIYAGIEPQISYTTIINFTTWANWNPPNINFWLRHWHQRCVVVVIETWESINFPSNYYLYYSLNEKR